MPAQHVILSQGLAGPPRDARFRDRARAFVSRHRGTAAAAELLVMAALFAAPLFTFSSGVLGIAFVLSMLWLRGSNVRDLGLSRPASWPKTVLRGVAAVAVILTVQGLVVQPLLRHLFARPPDFSRFHGMSLFQLAGWIAAGWALSAFIEEIIRAYLILRILELLGDTRAGRLGAVVGSSLFYALNHEYQGPAGAAGVVVTCVGLGLLYLYSRRNLWPNVVCHGLNDSVGFIAIYVGALS